MIALDLDGTLLDYSPEGPSPKINHALIRELAAQGVREVAILTNQGGLPFGVAGKLRKDGRPYPRPSQFCERMKCAVDALEDAGIQAKDARVSVWHKYAEPCHIAHAAQQTRAWLRDIGRVFAPGMRVRVYTTARARKPNPLMLRSVGATEYWGDSDEDEHAAANAGVPFVRVERYFEEVPHATR